VSLFGSQAVGVRRREERRGEERREGARAGGREGFLFFLFLTTGQQTHQTVAVVNGNRSPGNVRDVAHEGAVRLQKLPPQYSPGPGPVLPRLRRDVTARSAATVDVVLVVVPLHLGAGGHQPVVGPQAEVELLAERGDVEEEPLLLLLLLLGPCLPPDTLLVIGREQVRQVVSAGVCAEGRDQAILPQAAPQLFCVFSGDTTFTAHWFMFNTPGAPKSTSTTTIYIYIYLLSPQTFC